MRGIRIGKGYNRHHQQFPNINQRTHIQYFEKVKLTKITVLQQVILHWRY